MKVPGFKPSKCVVRLPLALALVSLLSSFPGAAEAGPCGFLPCYEGPDLLAFCPPPTQSRCLDAGYLQGVCGQRELATPGSICHGIIKSHAEASIQTLWSQGRTRESVDEQGSPVTSAWMYSPLKSAKFTGGAHWFGNREQRIQASSAQGTASAERNYQLDTPTLDSCDEYVYRKFWEASLFADEVARLGTDYRGMFQLAYGDMALPTSIGSRGRHGISPKSMNPAEDIAEIGQRMIAPPKNLFFLVPDEVVKDPRLNAMAGRLNQEKSRWKSAQKVNAWEWHAQQSQALSLHFSDAQLERAMEKAFEFERLVQEYYVPAALGLESITASLQQAHLQCTLGGPKVGGPISPWTLGSPAGPGGIVGGPKFPPLPGGPPDLFDRNLCLDSHLENMRHINQVEQRVAAAQKEIAEKLIPRLLEAEQEGWLDLSAPTAADWSPRYFYREAISWPITAFSRAREKSHAECMRRTANALSKLSDVSIGIVEGSGKNVVKRQLYGPQTYNDTWKRMDLYFTRLAEQLEKQQLAIQNLKLTLPRDAGGKVTLGRAASDSYAFQTDFFNVDASYAFGFSLKDYEQDLCKASPELHANFRIAGGALTETRELLNLMGAAKRAPERSFVEVRLLGNVVWNDGAPGLAFVLPKNAPDIGKVKLPELKTSGVFVVVFVPVTVEAGLVGELGVRGGLKGSVLPAAHAGSCSTVSELEARLAPYAQVDGMAAARVGIPGIGVGVGGAVNLVRASLPLEAKVALVVKPDPGSLPRLVGTADSSLALNLSLLDGRIYAFGEFLGLRAEHDLFKWSGPSISRSLWNEHFDLDLGALQQLKQAAPQLL